MRKVDGADGRRGRGHIGARGPAIALVRRLRPDAAGQQKRRQQRQQRAKPPPVRPMHASPPLSFLFYSNIIALFAASRKSFLLTKRAAVGQQESPAQHADVLRRRIEERGRCTTG